MKLESPVVYPEVPVAKLYWFQIDYHPTLTVGAAEAVVVVVPNIIIALN